VARRYVGGIFGNTVGSDTAIENLSGVFSISQQNYFRSENNGWRLPPGSSQNNPGTTPAALIAEGITTNGYYWLKGSASNPNSDARLFYCFLSGYNLGNGWAMIAHHDGSKSSSAAHQPRPTAWSNFVGYDNASGNGNTQGDPGQSDMVTSKSFSCNAGKIPFTKFAHVAYGGSNWNQTEAYYGGTWTSAQTIPNSAAWALGFTDTEGETFGGFTKKVSETNAGNSTNVKAVGCFNSISTSPNAGVVPYINGHSAGSASYPVYVGTWSYNNGQSSTLTFSWHDSATGVSGSNHGNGFDDFQDGSGMGDSWTVVGESANYARGFPSYIIIG